MEWTVTIEGRDDFGEVQPAQMRIGKDFERLKSGEIGLSIDDGKRIVMMLQELVVKQEVASYALARRVCPEIMKRLPRALPKPTTHVIDWFHLAMKIQPIQQIADHIVRSRPTLSGMLAVIDEEIERLKWKLWHGQVDRAISALDRIVGDMDHLGQDGDLSAARIGSTVLASSC